MTTDYSSLIGGCGAGAIALSTLPTVLLILSEVLGISKGKSNGILHFFICITEKIIKREKITKDELFECLRKAEEGTSELATRIEENHDEDSPESPAEVL